MIETQCRDLADAARFLMRLGLFVAAIAILAIACVSMGWGYPIWGAWL